MVILNILARTVGLAILVLVLMWLLNSLLIIFKEELKEGARDFSYFIFSFAIIMVLFFLALGGVFVLTGRSTIATILVVSISLIPLIADNT